MTYKCFCWKSLTNIVIYRREPTNVAIYRQNAKLWGLTSRNLRYFATVNNYAYHNYMQLLKSAAIVLVPGPMEIILVNLTVFFLKFETKQWMKPFSWHQINLSYLLMVLGLVQSKVSTMKENIHLLPCIKVLTCKCNSIARLQDHWKWNIYHVTL